MSYYLNTQEEAQAWRAYLKACEEDGLDGFSLHMWRVHGCPEGPCPALMEAQP